VLSVQVSQAFLFGSWEVERAGNRAWWNWDAGVPALRAP
jgi:hypothetical protein